MLKTGNIEILKIGYATPGQGTRAEVASHISHESSSGTVHNTTNIIDPTNATKIFQFTDSSSNIWHIGLLSSLQKRPSIYAANLEFTTVSWSLTASGNPYASTVQVQTDGVQTAKTQQNVDSYGNVTEQDIWDYAATSPTRIYRYLYLHNQNSTYAGYYIRNALVSKTVLDGTGNSPQLLGSITYDTTGGACPPYVAPTQPDPAITAPLHDPANRLIYLGNAMLFSTPGQGYSCKAYDAAGNVTRTEGPGNPGTQINYDSSSNFSAPSNAAVINDSASSLSSFTYTPWLTLSGFTGPNGITGTYSYDDYAQPTTVRLTGGVVIFYQYPGQTTTGGQVQLTYPSSYFPSPAFSNRFPWGQLSAIDGHFTRKTLDGLGRVVREERGPTGQNSMGTPTSVVDTQYGPCACSPMGKMVAQSQPYAPGASVYWTTYTYDGMGRTVKVTSPDGSASTITYNAPVSGIAPAPPSVGSSVTTVDAKNHWKTVTSDVFGNVAQVTEPNPANAGQPFLTYYTYNKINQLTQVSMPRNGYTQIRTMNYDPTSFVLNSETHPETGTTQYFYGTGSHTEPRLYIKQDAKGQQIKVEVADYDMYNRPKRRKFMVNSSGTEDLCQQINYTYDTYPASANHTSNTSWGHLTTSTVGPGGNSAACAAVVLGDGSRYNQSFLQVFDYTNIGQISLKRLVFNQIQTASDGSQQSIGGGTWDTTYTYDDEGYQTSITYPSGLTHNIGLDFMKRPYSLTGSRPGQSVAGPIIDSVTYNAADQVTQMSWPPNTPFQGSGGRDYDATTYPVFTETRTYNSLNQVMQIQTQANHVVNGAVQYSASGVDLNYQYTAGQNNGQVDGLASGLDGGNVNVSYTYDTLGRLKALSGVKNQTYSYDGWGNLYSKTGDGTNFTVNIDQATNRPFGGGICYDPNGNLVSVVTQCAPEYGYDIQNRLVRVAVTSNGKQDVSGHTDLSAEIYVYTADNKRVSTVRPNGNINQIIYVYGAKNEVAAVCTVQIFGQAPACAPGDLKFAGRIIRQNGVPVTVDRLGSVIGGPNGSDFGFGHAPAKYYLPYGEQWNSAQSPPAFPGGFNFASYFKDQTTGLDYADHRFYNSLNGFSRFMSADPYRRSAKTTDSSSWNKYSYVQGDPVNNTDRSGRWIDSPSLECGGDLDCEEDEPVDWGWEQPYVPVQEPTPPTPPDQPSCTVELGYTPNVFGSPFSHSFLYIAGVGYSKYVEVSPNFSTGAPTQQVNFSDSGIYNDSAIGKIVFAENGPNVCLDAASIYGTAKAYAQRTYLYLGVVSNSNSFASYLIYNAGLASGNIYTLVGPPNAIGYGSANVNY